MLVVNALLCIQLWCTICAFLFEFGMASFVATDTVDYTFVPQHSPSFLKKIRYWSISSLAGLPFDLITQLWADVRIITLL